MIAANTKTRSSFVNACCSCTQFRNEFRSPFFTLEEPTSTASNTLDVKRTFCRDPTKITLGLKLAMFLWASSVTVQTILKQTDPLFWFAYLTYWGWTCANLYFLFSFLTALSLSRRSSEAATGSAPSSGAGFLVNFTWGLYALILPAEIIIAALYWKLDFDPTEGTDYLSVTVHGGAILILLFDGTILNRAPLRMKQFLFLELFTLSYLAWNVTHSVLGIGNPNRTDGQNNDDDSMTNDDDAIYSALSWKNNLPMAAITTAVVLLVANPLSFLLCRAVTRVLPRRVVGGGANDDADGSSYMAAV